MSRISRFLPLMLLMLAGCTSEAMVSQTIYTNANIWTGVPGAPRAEALAVRDGRIVAVGTAEEVAAAGVEQAERVDLGGAFVVPGFIDNHTHFLTGGFQLASVDLRSAASPDEFSERIRLFAAGLPAGRWITGGDWDHEAWGGELPRRDWIDASTAEHPVFVNRLDGHMALANTAALRLAGITRDTRDPDGGTIVRDAATGEPTGVLKDEAMSLVYAVVPEPTEAEYDEALDRAVAHALALGVTQVHDVGSYGGWDDLATFRRAAAAGRL
jgi:predicted amidohydrolase YtcJ